MNNSLESVVRYIDENRLKLVTAESCTAGMVASTLADIPGSARWLECAYVTYSTDAKIRCLNVRQETIDNYNLTSEEVARELAEGALQTSRANLALSNTGLAGPGGDGEIPVGTVCFAWSFDHHGTTRTFSETRHFNGDRNDVRQSATEYAIGSIRHYHNTVRQQAEVG